MIKKSKVMHEISRLKDIHEKHLRHDAENVDLSEFNEYYTRELIIEHDIIGELEYLEDRIYNIPEEHVVEEAIDYLEANKWDSNYLELLKILNGE